MTSKHKPESTPSDSRIQELRRHARAALAQIHAAGAAGSEVVQASAGATAKKATEWVGEGVSVAGSLLGTTAQVVKDSAQGVWAWGADQLNDAMELVRETPGKIADLIVDDCEVATFLLPTGSRPNDFHCSFDFDEVLGKMKSGLLVRPRIVVWSGRGDIEKKHLAAVLKRDFTRQFREQKEKMLSEAGGKKGLIDRIKKLKKTHSEAGDNKTWAGVGLVSSIILILLISNPVADLLFLAWALYDGKNVLANTFTQIRATKDLEQVEAELEKERQRLERELDGKDQRFREAVSNLEVRVHPLLNEIVQDFCDIEGVAFLSGEQTTSQRDAPDVRTALHSEAYLREVPAWFKPLLDERTQT